jgi:hypothetical protein
MMLWVQLCYHGVWYCCWYSGGVVSVCCNSTMVVIPVCNKVQWWCYMYQCMVVVLQITVCGIVVMLHVSVYGKVLWLWYKHVVNVVKYSGAVVSMCVCVPDVVVRSIYLGTLTAPVRVSDIIVV